MTRALENRRGSTTFKARVEITSGDLKAEVAILDPSGKVRKTWIVRANVAPKTRTVGLKMNGTHTLRVRALSGSGQYEIATGETLKHFKRHFELVKSGTATALRVRFRAFAGDSVEAFVEGLLGLPLDPTLSLTSQAGPVPALAPFTQDSDGDHTSFSNLPIPHSGRFELRVLGPFTPGFKKVKAEMFLYVDHAKGRELLPIE